MTDDTGITTFGPQGVGTRLPAGIQRFRIKMIVQVDPPVGAQNLMPEERATFATPAIRHLVGAPRVQNPAIHTAASPLLDKITVTLYGQVETGAGAASAITIASPIFGAAMRGTKFIHRKVIHLEASLREEAPDPNEFDD